MCDFPPRARVAGIIDGVLGGGTCHFVPLLLDSFAQIIACFFCLVMSYVHAGKQTLPSVVNLPHAPTKSATKRTDAISRITAALHVAFCPLFLLLVQFRRAKFKQLIG
mmetsp:Transcript_10619/g.65476  ORF Transcript_10619/g.65476 Transcript_10619/m.65476 type:complete len:108 (+) Transcript_10619:4359-4682(+)